MKFNINDWYVIQITNIYNAVQYCKNKFGFNTLMEQTDDWYVSQNHPFVFIKIKELENVQTCYDLFYRTTYHSWLKADNFGDWGSDIILLIHKSQISRDDAMILKLSI